MTSTFLRRTTTRWVRHFVLARMQHFQMRSASDVPPLGPAVIGNVASAETSARYGGELDLVITNLTEYKPYVSVAAPLLYPLYTPAQAEVALSLRALTWICRPPSGTGSTRTKALLRSTWTGKKTATTASIRSHSSSSCTSGPMARHPSLTRVWLPTARTHRSSSPTSSSLSSILTTFRAVTGGR